MTSSADMRRRYRALWPMEWHRGLVTCLCCGAIAVVACVVALSASAWLAAGAFALPALLLLERILQFRIYWHWVIQIDGSGVTQIGGLGSPRYRARLGWAAVTTWERERLSGRGRPKVRGDHVYRYNLGDGVGPSVGWQSNYFPGNKELVEALIRRLGNPKDIDGQCESEPRG